MHCLVICLDSNYKQDFSVVGTDSSPGSAVLAPSNAVISFTRSGLLVMVDIEQLRRIQIAIQQLPIPLLAVCFSLGASPRVKSHVKKKNESI
jgi:hypothetical protein